MVPEKKTNTLRSPWEVCKETPHPSVCIQPAKLIKRRGLSVPFSNLGIQASSATKRRGELRDETLEEEVRQPGQPGQRRAQRQPCPEEVPRALEAGVQPQDLPPGALAVPRVVDDVTRQLELLVQRQLGGHTSFCLRPGQPVPPHQPGELRRRVAAGTGGRH